MTSKPEFDDGHSGHLVDLVSEVLTEVSVDEIRMILGADFIQEDECRALFKDIAESLRQKSPDLADMLDASLKKTI